MDTPAQNATIFYQEHFPGSIPRKTVFIVRGHFRCSVPLFVTRNTLLCVRFDLPRSISLIRALCEVLQALACTISSLGAALLFALWYVGRALGISR